MSIIHLANGASSLPLGKLYEACRNATFARLRTSCVAAAHGLGSANISNERQATDWLDCVQVRNEARADPH